MYDFIRWKFKGLQNRNFNNKIILTFVFHHDDFSLKPFVPLTIKVTTRSPRILRDFLFDLAVKVASIS
jgi:hypothetical protein